MSEAEAAPPMQTLSQYRGSNHDEQMGANELESSPEVRPQYAAKDSQFKQEERQSEPKTGSRHNTLGLVDGEMRTTSAKKP